MIDQCELKSLLDYNRETGIFRWKVATKGRGSRCRIGDIAGGGGGGRYWRISIKGKRYYAHQLAWFYVYGEWATELDHKDLNKTNNAIDNLRIASRSQNSANRSCQKTSKLGIKGVQRRTRNSYMARIKVEGKTVVLGYFSTAEEAHKVYCEAAKAVFGEFARAE